MKLTESNLICIDKDCKLNRVITNWNDLQTHQYYSHKIYPQEKFEKKVNIKLNEYNQKLGMQIEQSISEQIANQEQQINLRIKSLFFNLQKIYFVHLKDQIKINEKIESLSSNYQFDNNLKKYIEIYYYQFESPYQQQINIFLEGINNKLNGITKELINFIDQVDLQYQFEIQSSYNYTQKQQQEDLYYQKNNQLNQNSNQKYQYQQYDYKYSQQQSDLNTNQLQQQEDQTNVPLRWYKNAKNQQQRSQQYTVEQQQKNYQQQQQQQNLEQQFTAYIPKNDYNNDNDDRIQFQLPSETVQIKKNNPIKIRLIEVQDINEEQEDKQNIDSYQNQTKQNLKQEEKIVVQDNPQLTEEELQRQKQQNTVVQDIQVYQRINFVGKKFDLTNSDKHLKYSLRFTQYFCVQQGVALVEGAFTLNDNAKVKFKFTEPLNKTLIASFGMQNVDNYGKKLGTQNIYMDQSGILYKNEKQRQGQLKIDINQEYILQYRAEKRLLSFRKQEIAEYLHIEGSVSGSFKFYVKLNGMQVQIMK
ncbi:unnamed protein product [Paramecium primaurelia]|uniref:Uncharacterized protein n=1 Tax=Paramecium primaurelia TaxID=5886 RepID=A0A8S1K3H3_PARPR|nr:unnamed protein product [Paramecium primaurelia]